MNKTLRNKLKRLRTRPNPLPAPAAKPPAAPVHVAARKLLEGRRGVIIGGDARGQAQERIDEAFGLESLEWEHGNGQRRVQALAKRVESGKIDCLIFLRRFISHRLNDLLLKAADKAGALILWVDQGYGVTQVEQAALRVAGSAAAAR